MEIKRLRASHILISHEGATAQTSNRPAPAAEQEAGFIIQDIVEGLLTFDQAAREHREAEYKEFFNPDLFS